MGVAERNHAASHISSTSPLILLLPLFLSNQEPEDTEEVNINQYQGSVQQGQL